MSHSVKLHLSPHCLPINTCLHVSVYIGLKLATCAVFVFDLNEMCKILFVIILLLK